MSEQLFGICGEVYAVLLFFLLKIVLKRFNLENQFGLNTTFMQNCAYQVAIIVHKYSRLSAGHKQDVFADFKHGVYMLVFLHTIAKMTQDAVGFVKKCVGKTKTD